VYNLSGQSLTIDTSSGNNKIETISASASSTAVSRTTTNNNNNNANRTTNTQTSQSSNIFEKPVRLFADGVLNRLVIRTTPRTYASIKAVLDKLDIVPAQVLLQVLLVEVTLTESDDYGVEFSGTGSWNGNDIVYGNFFEDTSAIYSNGGGTFYISDPNDSNRTVSIRALAGNNLLKVVAKPQLLVSSHKQAVINVGAQVPIKTQSMTSTTSENVVNSVDYKDTGIILTVTPQVTSTDLISLDLKQEYSEAVVNGTSDIDSPEITNRVLETTMTIKNGCTMIIGGMIQEKKKDNLDSLPLIRSIPFLRRVFGNTSASEKRTELLLLITGYIVDEKCDIEEMVKRYNSAVKALESCYSKKKAKEEAKDIFGAFKK